MSKKPWTCFRGCSRRSIADATLSTARIPPPADDSGGWLGLDVRGTSTEAPARRQTATPPPQAQKLEQPTLEAAIREQIIQIRNLIAQELNP